MSTSLETLALMSKSKVNRASNRSIMRANRFSEQFHKQLTETKSRTKSSNIAHMANIARQSSLLTSHISNLKKHKTKRTHNTLQFSILENAKQLELETTNLAAIQEILEFDRKLTDKCETFNTEKAKKLAKLHSKLSWIKQVVVVVYIVLSPYVQVPQWCFSYYENQNWMLSYDCSVVTIDSGYGPG